MGLESVARQIIDEGQKEGDLIETEGLQEAKSILEDAREKAERIIEEREAQAERDVARIRQQEEARAEFDAKRKVLVAKRGLWDQLKREVLEELSQLPQAERKRILSRLLESASDEIPEGTVRVRDDDVDLLKQAKKYKVEGGLVGIGGLVVDDATATVSVDLRFESLLEDLWPQILKQESKRLFGER